MFSEHNFFRTEHNSCSTAGRTPAPERERVDSNSKTFSLKVSILNILSVEYIFSELCIFLDTLPSNLEVLCLQETWTSKENVFLLATLPVTSRSLASRGPKNMSVVQQSQ